jgi:nucleotide-binding universal stress UspA family protein
MKLLIAYDGSEFANAAIDDLRRAGLPAAAACEAVVLAVADVWPPLLDPNPPADHRLANPAIRELTRAARDNAEHALADARALAETGAARARAALPPAWTVRALATAGSPYAEVIRHAEASAADLIVVDSHGPGRPHDRCVPRAHVYRLAAPGRRAIPLGRGAAAGRGAHTAPPNRRASRSTALPSSTRVPAMVHGDRPRRRQLVCPETTVGWKTFGKFVDKLAL